MKFLATAVIVILLGLPSVTTAAGPCTSDAYNAFDFWLGDWEVRDKSGKLQGRNLIEKSADGCLITESWTATNNSTGTSINYYNAITQLWSQTWVSTGAVIEYSGAVTNPNELTLEGTIYYQQNNLKADFKGTWRLLDDGRVRQLFHQYNDKTEQWSVWFDGYYTKKDSDS